MDDEVETVEVCKKLVRVVNNWLFFSVIVMGALVRASSVFSTLTGVDGVGIAGMGLRDVPCRQKVCHKPFLQSPLSPLFALLSIIPFSSCRSRALPDSGARPDRSSHNHDLIHSTSFLFLLRRDGSHLCLQVQPIVCHCLSLFGHLSLYLRSPISKVESSDQF